MESRRLQPVIAFCWAVAAVGGLTFAYVLAHEGVAGVTRVEFFALLVGVVVGEVVPLRLPLRGGDEEANLSTPFAFAILMSVGLAPALIAQVVASLVQDVMARKPIWRSAFNLGQYVICLAAANAFLVAFGLHPAAGAPARTLLDITGAVVAGGVFFGLNFLIVGFAVATYQGMTLRTHLRNDLKTTSLIAGVSISLAPLVLAAVHQSAWLLALFILPFFAVHSSGRLACESARQALHDALTGLPNRMRFRQLMDQAILSPRADQRFAVMMLDLNRFKEVNDTLGHHYGDLLLQETAARLQAALDGDHVVARLGGDEFAVLVTDEDPEDVAARVGEALAPPVELDGFLLEIDASIGSARYPQDGTDMETLLRRADVAMYTAKERDGGHLAYSAQIDEYDPTRLALVADLRRALDAEELVLFYQPKLDLRARTVVAVEALVRWRHPTLGMLQPGAFVDMAEHTGLIKPLTRYVIEKAIRQCAVWQQKGLDLQVAVNVSPRSLLDRSLVATVATALEANGLAADRLKLEITETAIMVDTTAATIVLDELAAIGVGLSVDDFGTGYSSLAYLKRLPVGEVKIDRSFVHDMATQDDDRAIVRSIIDLAANLNLRVVAEGVEDAATLEELARLGCDEAQGYFISRPAPAHELGAWLRAAPLAPPQYSGGGIGAAGVAA